MSEPKPDAHSNQNEIWDYFQNDAPESFEGSRPRLEYLVNRVGRAPAVVLDIGVGTGIFEEMALKRGHDVYSLDPSERSIAMLRERHGMGDRAQVGYSQQMPFGDAMFDAVVISEVIEHLTPEITAQTLLEIRRVLKPGGRMIGTVPAREDLALQRVVCPDCGKRFHRWGHEQSFTVDSMRRVIEPVLSIVRVEERPFYPFGLMNWRGKVLGGIKLAGWRAGMKLSNQNVYFEAEKTA